MNLKILLAVPEDRTTLGIIGSYCKKALEELGNEVVIFDFRAHPYSRNKVVSFLKSTVRPFFPSLPSPYDIPVVKSAVDKQINEALVERARIYRPDLLLVLVGENIFPSTLDKVKKMNIVSANWLFDSMYLSYSAAIVKGMHFYYDHIFIIDSPGILSCLKMKTANITTLPLACDPGVHRKMDLSEAELVEYGSDIAFVGTVTPEREKLFEHLSDFDMKIWGRWQRKPSFCKARYMKKDIYAEEAVKVYNAAKITLDFHNLYGMKKSVYNVTPRVFEVPASKGFVLTNYASQIDDFYKIGEEIAVYRDIDELKSLIKYYLGHEQERREMSRSANERACSEHTYRVRLEKLLKVIFQSKK